MFAALSNTTPAFSLVEGGAYDAPETDSPLAVAIRPTSTLYVRRVTGGWKIR